MSQSDDNLNGFLDAVKTAMIAEASASNSVFPVIRKQKTGVRFMFGGKIEVVQEPDPPCPSTVWPLPSGTEYVPTTAVTLASATYRMPSPSPYQTTTADDWQPLGRGAADGGYPPFRFRMRGAPWRYTGWISNPPSPGCGTFDEVCRTSAWSQEKAGNEYRLDIYPEGAVLWLL